MRILNEREYSHDLHIETRRPFPPRNLVYNEATMELSWTGPNGGPRFTHYKIRLGDDSEESSHCVPINTNRLFIARTEKVTITCWNHTVRTESDAARISIGAGSVTWVGSDSSAFGITSCWQVEYTLTTASPILVVTSPVIPAANKRLLVFVNADPTTFYPFSFDPATFVQYQQQFVDPAMKWVREYSGRSSDAKWYPIGPSTTYDPSL